MQMREADFQQQIFATSVGPQDDLLYWHMFDPDHVPGEFMDDSDVVTPTSLDELEELLDAWEAEDKAVAQGQQPESFRSTLGFKN